MLCFKLFKIVPETATYIDEKYWILSISRESFVNGIEAWVHPATFALTISTHVVVEMLKMLRSLTKPEKKGVLSIVCILKWTVSNIIRILVI